MPKVKKDAQGENGQDARTEEAPANAKTGCTVQKAGRFLGAGIIVFLLIWYCLHPDYYGGKGFGALFTNARTYAMIVGASVLLAVVLIPNRLPEEINRRVGFAWLFLSPFVIYFSLLYLNAVKFSIHFTKLNKIAVLFTFWFLYLVVFFLVVLTGSVRVSVSVVQTAVAVLGIVNCFVIVTDYTSKQFLSDFQYTQSRAVNFLPLFSVTCMLLLEFRDINNQGT